MANGTASPDNYRTGKQLFAGKDHQAGHNRKAGHARQLRQIGVRANRRKQAAKFRDWREDYNL